MNAAGALIELVVEQLAPAAVQRLAARARSRFDASTSGSEPTVAGGALALRHRLAARYGDDAIALLNACRVEELSALARRLGLASSAPEAWQRAAPGAGDPAAAPAVRGRAGALRLTLWRAFAPPSTATSAAASWPLLVGDRLVACAPARGLSPPAAAWPRPLPAPCHAAPPDEEPECLDTLLDAADRALGVRLGGRGRAGKGIWGQRAAELLGVLDRGAAEPDWRGDVEIKTVAVARSASGAWRVIEDPAISTVGAAPLAKLQRVLWLCRAGAEDGDATLISWYLLDWDDEVAQLVRRYLHIRPKGPRGSAGRGYYLHKRFFADAGLLASLNGPHLHDHR